MSEEFDSIMRGLQEAVDDAQGKTSLEREIVQIVDMKSKIKDSHPDFLETPDP
ncbi:hypothetical protein H0486_07775 [Lachnospiraceae bacterium MD1]|uniref:Uncharacterized protein n=1 Tax=Variimorphobacter saccharofermentans TaxID=2755051 RepID=A0A839JZH2_9FIRM|nr:hypothetical protein [Variimorphobacter saccharofermentans]MBB2182774.1 hypothetical protein [Variimorphobacter saccharofermentans]